MILKKIIEGYHHYNSNLALRATMFILFSSGLLNVLMASINYWEDMIERFMGLKDIVLFFCLSSSAVDISLRFERCNALLAVIEDKFLGEGEWTDSETCSQYREQLVSLDQTIWNVIRFTIFNMNTWPLFAIIVLSISGVKLQHPPLPCAYYLPDGWNNFSFQTTVFFLQTCCLWIFSVVGHIILSSVTVATQKCVLDFELFISLVDSFEKNSNGIGKRIIKEHTEYDDYTLCSSFDDSKSGDVDEGSLREQMRKLVEYHQKLFNTVKILDKNAGFATSISNTNICLINCIYLYIFVKTDMVVVRVFTFCYVLFSFFLVFFYCNSGQNIINRNEDVRRRLSEVSWMSRPQWFQRALILMITRGNGNVQLNPYGLYVLNHATFTNILNFSYTSSNLLKALS